MPPKRKGNRNNAKHGKNEKETVFAELGQGYAQVLKRMGSGGGSVQIKILCSDGQERVGIIRGKMVKRRGQFVNPGDIVLIQYGTAKDDFCEIIKKYFPKEAKVLRDKRLLNFVSSESSNFEIDESLNSHINFTEEQEVKYAEGYKPLDMPQSDESEEEYEEEEEVVRKTDKFGNYIDDDGKPIEVTKEQLFSKKQKKQKNLESSESSRNATEEDELDIDDI